MPLHGTAGRFLVLLVSLLGICCFCAPGSWASTVLVDVLHSQDGYEAGKSYPMLFDLRISSPWYIHGTEKEGDLIPTVISLEEKPGTKISGILFPPAERKKFPYADHPLSVFSGKILVRATLTIAEDAPKGEQMVRGKLSYQACSGTACLPPEDTPLAFSLKVVSAGTPIKPLNQDLFLSTRDARPAEKERPKAPSGTGLWLTLLGFFVGGIALNLTPCIYPLIPITVSYFSGGQQKSTMITVINAVLYLLGLAITNSGLGVWAAFSGHMIGTALQSPLVILFLTCLFLVLALSSFGFWEFRLPSVLTRVSSKTFGGYFGTFFMGLTLGIIAAPCLGPFVLGLLTYVGQIGDPFLGFICFFSLSLGLGLPLSVLALFSGALTRLPLSGDWLLWVRKLMGWVLVLMAAYILKPLVASHVIEVGLLAAVVFAAGIHLGWLDRAGASARRFFYFKKGLGVALMGGAILYFLSGAFQGQGVVWAPYEEVLVSKAAQENKPVILDFSAEWCGPCQIMEHTVFKDPEIVKLSRLFLNMRLDLTHRQENQEEILSRHHVKGVPTILFLNREGKEESSLRIESLVDKSEFLERMKTLLTKSPAASS